MRNVIAALVLAAWLPSAAALAEAIPSDPNKSSDAGAPNSLGPGKQVLSALTRADAWLALAGIACDPAAAPLPPDEAMSWSGACTAKLLDGPGDLVVRKQGNVFLTLTGQFTKGVAEGHETIRYNDGTVFEGEFHANKPNGPGALRTPRGFVLEADFHDDVPNGKVRFALASGEVVERTYKDGVADGPATIDWIDMKTVLAYRAGLIDGPAVTTYNDGSRLEFGFKADVADPVASFTAPDGQRLSGAFVPSRIDPSLPPHALSYPPDALLAQDTGTAYVSLIIGPSGHVQNASLAKTSGFDDLDTAAVEAVRSWSYIAATIDGHPISTGRMVPVPFVIH